MTRQIRLQANWDARAALNFMCGGAGAGLMIAVALLQPAGAAAGVVASLLLVGTGLAAVWHELGKRLRAPHVFFNPMTSWMSRESFAVLLLFPLGIGALFTPRLVPFAALAAAVFLYCQVRMLQGAKGIPAWRAKATAPLMLTTAMAEGTGLALFITSDVLAIGFFVFAVLARAAASRHYSRAAPNPALEAAEHRLIELGTVVPVALAIPALWFAPAAWLAGGLALAAGWQLKLALVTRASIKQGFALPQLPVRGTR